MNVLATATADVDLCGSHVYRHLYARGVDKTLTSPDAHPQSLGSTAGPGSSRSATRGVEVSSFLVECGAHFSSCPRVVADMLRPSPFWPPPTADSCARCFTCSAAHLSVVVVLDLEERVDAAVGLAAAHCSTGVSAALCPASSFFFSPARQRC